MTDHIPSDDEMREGHMALVKSYGGDPETGAREWDRWLAAHDAKVKASTITAETVIDSPRYVADGRGAWRGTVREAVEAERQNPTSTALGHLDEALRAEGKLPELPEEDSEDPEEYAFDVDRHAHLLTIGHLRDLLDDPNATIVQAGEE